MWLCCPMRSRRVVSRTSATLIALAEEEEEEDEEEEEEAIREAGRAARRRVLERAGRHEARNSHACLHNRPRADRLP